ncbi:MAG: ABC transporter [Candidatus Raymondbacteria bacterium RifOxyC12_full_50_8]|uniref:ABC transporter n=1 Tax=Candidatus Raymondbacteria bacterium RIFOXYD12_FULL_49_13 TaxID=1817890 RepID=A0A1F7F9R9_UNCRA|nr:MAG: ABC transporter [Candidatus Raymondbacteria bacterium RifOxyB12_full_50_8]OGJ93256.1 MAG: ABC transporter [Candidatus Raymondbacteria bacterium RIFOXYA2_FULL_49_16]OGJ98161.1 MAG: ABC transporter [Candidatus Raymondbacteria bacterium RifOxyC12_full_50_8]OGK03338.1 MAG: ABC transporter [Candidatus Raymondbacteria bacterium RIFOXYD12_FULL_49_13]OGP44978.1 MAG: ABC transporter [Candidatus Raymondbacteria bacterium RIFOXYB2_FULL_49_35]
MNIIELKNVIKDYPLGETTVHALRGIDLAVEKGNLLSIMGPSGSGKTTLLNIIGCIDFATTGTIAVGGTEIHELKDSAITDIRLHKIGFIFQTFNLIPVLNATENVEFPLLLMKKYSKTEVRKKALELIDKVGLTEYSHHRPAELSGGQRQRVAIARALVTNPDIVLADEPTANLDSVTGAQILETMMEMNRVSQTTFIFSTHDEHVLKYARAVVKIRDGLIVKEG